MFSQFLKFQTIMLSEGQSRHGGIKILKLFSVALLQDYQTGRSIKEFLGHMYRQYCYKLLQIFVHHSPTPLLCSAHTTTSSSSSSPSSHHPLRLFVSLEMPVKHLHKHFLSISLQYISMARNHGMKVPLGDLRHAVVETFTVLGEEIPVESL